MAIFSRRRIRPGVRSHRRRKKGKNAIACRRRLTISPRGLETNFDLPVSECPQPESGLRYFIEGIRSVTATVGRGNQHPWPEE